MEQAKKKFDDASSVHIDLSTDVDPLRAATACSARPATSPTTPAFEGDVKVVLSGLTATVPITSVDGKVYAKLPLSDEATP